MRLIDYFDKGAALAPDHPFLIGDDATLTYRQAQQSSHRIAHALLNAGVKPGSHIAVISHNSARAFACVLGLLRAGCVWIPVSPRNVAEETAYQLDHADVQVLFYDNPSRAILPETMRSCPKVRHYIAIDGPDEFGKALNEFADRDPSSPIDLPYDFEDLAVIPYTGGTTGRPKGVMHTHRSYEVMALSMHMDVGQERPVYLVTAPMTHAAGGLALCVSHTVSTNIVLPGFDVERVLDSIERCRVTHIFLPPTAIYMMLAHPTVRRRDYSSLRCILYAGAPIFEEKLKEALEIFGPVLCQAYAQTESLPNLTFLPQREHVVGDDPKAKTRLSSCGRPVMTARISIQDDDDRQLGVGERGEICVQSLNLMKGYYKDPDQTAQTICGGWLHTGDIGYFDEEGYLYIVDRKKDMIVSGGFNIYPAEVEQAIARHPAVLDCAVIGVPDEKWGEAVKAVVQLKGGIDISAQEIETFCRNHLSGIKVPKSFEIVEDLPRSPVGKVLKSKLREPYWTGRARKI